MTSSKNLPVVVGVDGSESALTAVRWAAGDAVLHRAPLELVSAVSVGAVASLAGTEVPESVVERAEVEAQGWLSAAAEVARQVAGEVDLSREHLRGGPVSVLVSASEHASKVVVGTRGLAEFTGLAVGSTAEALVAHGKCPVAAVRRVPESTDTPRPVIVGVDGSRVGEAALAVAFEEASVRDAPLVAVHTWADFAPGSWPEFDDGLCWDVVQEREHQVLAERLAGWQEKYPHVPVRRVVERDRPVRYLAEHAADADLLVVGSRGRGGVAGMLIGSTSRALLHTAPCPLLVVRTSKAP